jgi:ParB-like chromosome segregation protein Spo0J
MEQRNIKEISKNGRHRKDLGDLAQLAKSIDEVGLLHPVVINASNTLIAGERRLEACKLLGWQKIPVRVIDLQSIVRGEYDENTMRKDFTNSEAFAIYAEVKPLMDEEAKKRQGYEQLGKISPTEKGRSRDKASAGVGRSGKTMEKIETIVYAAEEMGLPELVEIMDNKSVEAAHKELQRKKKEQEHKKLARLAETVPASDRWNVFQGDIWKVELEPNSLDVIITDPPYPQDCLPLWSALAIFAKRHLKVGGALFAMTGNLYLPDILNMLGEHLTYQWQLACTLPGQHSEVHAAWVNNQMWKPILVYRNGGDLVNIGSDLFQNAGRDKDFHEWGQGVDGYLWQIDKFTKPNDLICDPFLGGGTTGVAALQLKRRFVGFDVDPEKVAISRGRLVGIQEGE